jgi:NAD(P)-dependent dehydrogenase (short-subunit alcohol dehydrogenase family)
MRLQNKVALITGGSRGLGRGIAVGFAKEGSDIIINYRERKDRADEVIEEIRNLGRNAEAIRADIGNTQKIEGFIEKAWSIFGRIDILLNNAGLDMLTKSMATELGPYGINVNSISPDIVRTEILPEGFLENEGVAFIKKTPLGRKAEIDNCVGPAIFLASDESSYIQGHILVLDGGMSITQV